jgi:thiamine-phosphate diphosphorylase
MSIALEDFPIVHAVTDSTIVMQDGFLERATGVMRALGNRGALHLRSSRLSGREFHELATLLAKFQDITGCWLIVNDRVDIAAAVRARGVQLASHSLPIADALAVSKKLPVGASIHSVDEAIEAEAEGASWCVAGAVFETPSHAGQAPARLEFIERVASAVKIPVIAIGGVTPETVQSLKSAGAYGIATIRGAGWDRGLDSSESADDLLKTRLPVLDDTGFVEPVTRYISAYDSDSGNSQDNHPDGERSPEGAGA